MMAPFMTMKKGLMTTMKTNLLILTIFLALVPQKVNQITINLESRAYLIPAQVWLREFVFVLEGFYSCTII